MFYCDECREKKNWPESLVMSIGQCEVCSQMRSCWDVKSSDLPLPPKSQHGREPDKVKPECNNCVYLEADGEIINRHIEKIMRLEARLEEPENVKPLAEYLGEYIEQEMEDAWPLRYRADARTWRELLEQALDAYESTEQVKIKVERV